ncbi:hypothetical protein J3E68DRAFT_403668 [Trichoderma sp. SZMC 28012]
MLSTRLAVQSSAAPCMGMYVPVQMDRDRPIASPIQLLLGLGLACAAPSTGTGILYRCYRRLICKGTRTGATESVRSARLA